MKKFETVEEVKDSNAMKASLAALKRLNRPTEFMFKARCEALELQPLLLLARPGTKVDRALAKELKAGSKTIYGEVRRRGVTLLFSPRGQRPNKKEMVRLIAQVGRQNQVTLPLSRIIVTTQLESRAINAVEASLRRLGRVNKPTPFIFNARWGPIRGPAFVLGDGGRDRYFSMLRDGPAVEGTVQKEGRRIVLTVEKGTANPGAMARLIVQAGREIRVSIRRPEVRIGGTATATTEDLSAAPKKGTSAPTSTAAPTASTPAPTTAKSPTKAPAPKTQSPEEKARLAEEKRQKEASAKEAKRKEQERRAEAKRKAEVERQRKAEEARREEEARQERERQEQERAERERQAAAQAAEIAKLPKYRKQLSRAEGDADDAESDLSEASVGLKRESAMLQRLRKISEPGPLSALFTELQDAIIADSGKPDKELQKLLRGLPDEDEDDEDELEDAMEEAREFLEERIEEYEDDLGDLRKDAEEAIEKRDALRAKVAALEALT